MEAEIIGGTLGVAFAVLIVTTIVFQVVKIITMVMDIMDRAKVRKSIYDYNVWHQTKG